MNRFLYICSMEEILKHIKFLHDRAMTPFFEKSKFKRFLTEEEFQNDYGKITLISHNRNKAENLIKKLSNVL